MSEAELNYSLTPPASGQSLSLPNLNYRPPVPCHYRPPIGLIGCGGITQEHLKACRVAGYDVVALCDLDPTRAEARRAEFFPHAEIFTDYRRVLARDDIEVVDVALHPEARAAVLRAALQAGKHVLSQKPFVTDLAVGRELVQLARQRHLKLAVNQNGRWAPYLALIREAIQAGLLGQIASAEVSIRWDHTWTKGTPFEEVHHLVLYDFGIHWFDAVASFFRNHRAQRVWATALPFPGQQIKPPLLASALIEFGSGLASLTFNGHNRHDPQESIVVAGSLGTARSQGPVCASERVRLETKEGVAEPELEGRWFDDGFRGAIGELLCAIEEDREPLNGAEENLRSLELCFAACVAADTGRPQVPALVQRLPA
jgi:predicted dehydrogenase